MTFEEKTDDPLSDTGSGELERPPSRARPPNPILVVLHQERSTPSHVGQTLVRHGYKLDIRKPRFGDPLPETLAAHSGAVIFGGPMSANDRLDYIKQETDWIGVALREKKPFLGICLGAQMLARHLGARVFRDPYARAEIGYHDIEPVRSNADSIEWPNRVYQWHRDGFDLPTGADLLATAGGPYRNQAFQYGTAVAIQFHPEISYAQVSRWSNNRQRLMLPGAQPRPRQLADHVAHAPKVQRWLDAYLRHWVRIGAE